MSSTSIPMAETPFDCQVGAAITMMDQSPPSRVLKLGQILGLLDAAGVRALRCGPTNETKKTLVELFSDRYALDPQRVREAMRQFFAAGPVSSEAQGLLDKRPLPYNQWPPVHFYCLRWMPGPVKAHSRCIRGNLNMPSLDGMGSAHRAVRRLLDAPSSDEFRVLLAIREDNVRPRQENFIRGHKVLFIMSKLKRACETNPLPPLRRSEVNEWLFATANHVIVNNRSDFLLLPGHVISILWCAMDLYRQPVIDPRL
jgi:hypothetical protein